MNISAKTPLMLLKPFVKTPSQLRFGEDASKDPEEPVVSQVTNGDIFQNTPSVTEEAPQAPLVSKKELQDCYNEGFRKPTTVIGLLSVLGIAALGLLNLQNRDILTLEKSRTQAIKISNEMLRQALEEMSEPLPPQQMHPQGPQFRIMP